MAVVKVIQAVRQKTMSTVSLRIQYSSTARLKVLNGYDVARLN